MTSKSNQATSVIRVYVSGREKEAFKHLANSRQNTMSKMLRRQTVKLIREHEGRVQLA